MFTSILQLSASGCIRWLNRVYVYSTALCKWLYPLIKPCLRLFHSSLQVAVPADQAMFTSIPQLSASGCIHWRCVYVYSTALCKWLYPLIKPCLRLFHSSLQVAVSADQAMFTSIPQLSASGCIHWRCVYVYSTALCKWLYPLIKPCLRLFHSSLQVAVPADQAMFTSIPQLSASGCIHWRCVYVYSTALCKWLYPLIKPCLRLFHSSLQVAVPADQAMFTSIPQLSASGCIRWLNPVYVYSTALCKWLYPLIKPCLRLFHSSLQVAVSTDVVFTSIPQLSASGCIRWLNRVYVYSTALCKWLYPLIKPCLRLFHSSLQVAVPADQAMFTSIPQLSASGCIHWRCVYVYSTALCKWLYPLIKPCLRLFHSSLQVAVSADQAMFTSIPQLSASGCIHWRCVYVYSTALCKWLYPLIKPCLRLFHSSLQVAVPADQAMFTSIPQLSASGCTRWSSHVYVYSTALCKWLYPLTLCLRLFHSSLQVAVSAD